MSAAYYNLVDKCIMIEKDEDVASVWTTILYGDWEWLADQIQTVKLTPETARKIIEAPTNTCEEKAFRTIIKNRVCHGGIMADGSGLLKYGERGKGILSRWYPDTLVKRIKEIVTMKDRLVFIEGDAFDHIPQYKNNKNVCFFVDPPYTASTKKAGRRLYRYSEIDHEGLFRLLEEMDGKFLLTYDCDDAIINLAKRAGFNYRRIPMTGTHNSVRYELVISNTSI